MEPNEKFSEKRRDTVERARQAWIKRLIDLSRRNNLLYYRPLKRGTLSLSLDDAGCLAALLHGDSIRLKTLVTGLSDEELMARVLSIWRRSQANQEEKGLTTMFVALGMAGWKAADEGRNPDSPVLLLPAALELKGRSGAAVSVHRAGPIQVNLVLLHVLQEEYGLTISPDRLLPLLGGHDEEEAIDPMALYREFEESCKTIPDFAIKGTAVLGNFAFQKMAMVRDLRENLDCLVSSDLVAALAGDVEAKGLIDAKRVDPDPKELDRTPPQSEFLVLDADSSQQCAVAAAMQGQSAVVHGPPGTGKSQTIANVIASLAAAGKSVLFVAEKRAALEAVLKRLQHVGLEKVTVDLHGADVSARHVMEQVAAALDAVQQSVSIACDEMHQRYAERRDRLNRHVESLHKPRTPGGLSVYELQGIILSLRAQVQAETRWREVALRKIETFGPTKVRDLLREAEGFASLFLRCDPSPWNGVELRGGPAAQEAVDVVARLASRTLPEFIASLSEVVKMTGFPMPGSLKEVREAYSLLDAVGETLEVYSPRLFQLNIRGLMDSLAAGRNGGVRAVWNWCSNSKYRKARSQALASRKPGKASTATLFTELSGAEDQRTGWAALTGGSSLPDMPRCYSDGRINFELVSGDLQTLACIVARNNIDLLRLAKLTEYVAGLAADRLTPMKLPKLFEIEHSLEAAGVGNLIEDLRRGSIEPEKWTLAFDYCWYSSCLEAAQADDPEVAGFSGKTHDGFVREFKDLDKERVRVAAARVRRAWAERAVATMNEHKSEEHVVRSEVEKKRKHMSLRQLFGKARNVLTSVCPCWMASPLSVSQLLDTAKSFDFVIFDEASQVVPEDAIPAIMRGRSLVVAGDRWQLPPTTFFASAEDDELAEDETVSGAEGYESLLDATNAILPSWHLNWHYRSRDEALIGFSNHHIYKDRLVTFPGPGGPPAIQHVLIQQPPGVDGQEESCSAEVRRVAELVLEHAEKYPRRSLGVIAMGIRHADRVQRAIDEALSGRPELSEFFDANAEERFFVKNLERVQGDERDSIILTVGYGKDRAGNLPFRFGPLLSFGGRRRLNVAVTRARRQMTVVSSFSHLDMDLAKVKPDTGVEMLRDYLEYAASGGKRLGGPASTTFPMNSFEAEVFDVLTSKGIPLVPQVGASGYRIDLVAQHPKQPGRYVLAIECDGASYHSSPTARDRDRLRQQQLENLGWKFHRIWSTDWFMRKDEEIQRATVAYREAVLFADGPGDHNETAVSAVSCSGMGSVSNDRIPCRAPRPDIAVRDAITKYSEWELLAMIDWIQSDGRLRTDEEIVDELVLDLGFQRRGARIEGVLKSVLARHQNGASFRGQ